MADAGRAMPNLDRSNGLFARLNAVQEVADMVNAIVPVDVLGTVRDASRQADIVGPDLGVHQRLGFQAGALRHRPGRRKPRPHRTQEVEEQGLGGPRIVHARWRPELGKGGDGIGVLRIDSPVQDGPGGGAVHRTGVQELESKTIGDLVGNAALARTCRAVNRDYQSIILFGGSG